MAQVYGLIFDVDGVIADTEGVNTRITIRILSKLFGLDQLRKEDFEAGLGRGAEEYVRVGARTQGVELTPEQVAEATAARQAGFLKNLEQHPLPPFPGVMDLIDAALQRSDFRLAVATSGTRAKSEAVLRSAGIPYGQMAYVTGDDVARRKPDPELFLVAAREVGLAPRDCVVIEDAPNGIEAAHAAGCGCIAVTNSAPAERLSAADRVVSSLTEIGLDDVIAVSSRPQGP